MVPQSPLSDKYCRYKSIETQPRSLDADIREKRRGSIIKIKARKGWYSRASSSAPRKKDQVSLTKGNKLSGIQTKASP